jgi:uncharacterized protein DUF1996
MRLGLESIKGNFRRGIVALAAILLPLLPTAVHGAGSAGQFVVRCPFSHTLPDDPIVLPGQPGASHSHDFFGNVTVNADSTVKSMLAGDTTCRVASDTAGYWAPTAYLNGQLIEPKVMRIYYLGIPAASVETIPPGLQMIGGNRDATSPDENPNVRWSCGETSTVKTPRSKTPYNCGPWADRYAFVDGVIATITMPNCWDGTGLGPDSVAYPEVGTCPAGFPHVLPRLSERVHYGIMDPTSPDGSIALTLSSGAYWSFHADFWNTWQQPRLDQLVQECLVARTHCGAVDASGEIAWIHQFGTTRYDLGYAAATDGSGVYVAGFTNYALDGQEYHRRYDAFVRKYDADGSVLWTRQFGSSGTDQVFAIAADAKGVTVAGSTDGRLPDQKSAGGVDAFVARFGLGGDQQWLRQFGTRQDDRATAVTIGANGTFVAGSTAGTFRHRHGGSTDAFVARVEGSGDLPWIRQFGTEMADDVAGLYAGGLRLYAVGWTAEPPSEDVAEGATDGFVMAFNPGGSPLWRRQISTAGTDRVNAIAARGRALFLAGSTDGSLSKEPPAGGVDAFVAKLDPDGSRYWIRQFGSVTDDEAVAIGADRKGVYVAGSTTGSLPDGELLGESDGFIRRYLLNGTQTWTRQFGTLDYERVYGLAAEPAGLYLVGTTHGTFEGQVNAGDRDVFVVRVAFS